MKRFTKQINLVLISSSLFLHGCEEGRVGRAAIQQHPPPRRGADGKLHAEEVPPELLTEEERRQQQSGGQVVGSPGGAAGPVYPVYPGGGYFPGHHIFVPFPMHDTVVYRGGGSSAPSAASGMNFASSHHSGTAGVGGSVRGGFGASAHGASS